MATVKTSESSFRVLALPRSKSNEGLSLDRRETSAFESFCGGQFTLSTQVINQIILHDSVWEPGIWSRAIINNSMITINNNNSDLPLLYHCLMRVVYLVCSLLSQEITKRIPHRMQTQSLDSSRDTLLSQDVAVSLLQENKMALKRCELVRRPNTVMKHMWISR